MPNTQSMGTEGTDGAAFCFSKKASDPALAAPMAPHQRSVFTDLEREELKQIIREVLCDI
tara:strand:+ start:232 stop:411 length:180 start_codon:yes stop_codon:yes gene_type:complete